MLDPVALGQALIDDLGITDPAAQAKVKQLGATIVNFFRDHAEVDIGDIGIQVSNVSDGLESRDAAKTGTGKLL